MTSGKTKFAGGGKGTWAGLMGAALLALALAGPLLAADGQGGAAFLAGLEALGAGRWNEAEAAFGQAVAADGDNSEYLTARGVARALAMRPAEAVPDLQRALRLREDNWEAKLWLGAAYYMSGDANNASLNVTHGPRGQQASKEDLDYSTFVQSLGLGCWQTLQGRKARIMVGRELTEMSLADMQARLFPRAAAMFASRRKTQASPGLAGDLLQRATDNLRGKRFAQALKDLDSLLAATPEDDKLLFMRAECLAALGDYAGGRREYTRVLTSQPAWGAAYGGRAVTAARMGDAARAAADLATAVRLGAEVSAQRAEVEAASAVIKPPEPATALAALERAVAAGADQPRLAELALATHWAVNARRLRHDEVYQDRLRLLDEALKAEPRNPDRLAEMAAFLFDESYPPFEQVEPGSWPVFYRHVPQGQPKFGPDGQLLPAPPEQRTGREVARAKALADEAIRINPGHYRAMGIKGQVLNYEGQHENALAILDKAVAIKGDDPALLRERSVALQALARQNMLAAGALRNPTVNRTKNQDGTVTITTVYPSAADLARAAELEALAKELGQRASQDMTKAQRLTAGTALGAYYQGLVDHAHHNLPQAQADFQEAVRLAPDYREAWRQLAQVNHELGQPEQWATAREGMLRPIHTTAGPWLTIAVPMINATRFGAARAALAEARRADAADARALAYQAVIEAADNKIDEALVKYRAALELEQARARLHGSDPNAPGGGPVDPREAGLTLGLRNVIGGLLFESGQAQRAGRLFQANLDFLSALPPEKLATPAPAAFLPSTTADPAAKPTVETYAMLQVRAQAGVDFAKWAGQYNDPKDAALAAATFKRLVAQAKVDTTKPEVLQAVMNLAMAQLELSKGNHARALFLLRDAGATPQPLWQEMRRTEAEARRGGQAVEAERFNQEQERRSRMSPADAQRERLLSDRQFFEKSRASTLDSLNQPGLSPQDRRALEGSVAQYDRMIRDIDRKLGR